MASTYSIHKYNKPRHNRGVLWLPWCYNHARTHTYAHTYAHAQSHAY